MPSYEFWGFLWRGCSDCSLLGHNSANSRRGILTFQGNTMTRSAGLKCRVRNRLSYAGSLQEWWPHRCVGKGQEMGPSQGQLELWAGKWPHSGPQNPDIMNQPVSCVTRINPENGGNMFIVISVSAYTSTWCQNQKTTICIISRLCRQILYSLVLDHKLILQVPYVFSIHDKSIPSPSLQCRTVETSLLINIRTHHKIQDKYLYRGQTLRAVGMKSQGLKACLPLPSTPSPARRCRYLHVQWVHTAVTAIQDYILFNHDITPEAPAYWGTCIQIPFMLRLKHAFIHRLAVNWLLTAIKSVTFHLQYLTFG
jgi:hypothetical protein